MTSRSLPFPHSDWPSDFLIDDGCKENYRDWNHFPVASSIGGFKFAPQLHDVPATFQVTTKLSEENIARLQQTKLPKLPHLRMPLLMQPLGEGCLRVICGDIQGVYIKATSSVTTVDGLSWSCSQFMKIGGRCITKDWKACEYILKVIRTL
jgi:hypothetical protein